MNSSGAPGLLGESHVFDPPPLSALSRFGNYVTIRHVFTSSDTDADDFTLHDVRCQIRLHGPHQEACRLNRVPEIRSVQAKRWFLERSWLTLRNI